MRTDDKKPKRGRSPTTTPDELFNLLYQLGGGLIEPSTIKERLHISAATLSRLKRKLIESGRLACLYSKNYCCYILVDDRLAIMEANRSERSLLLKPFRRYLITRQQLINIVERQQNIDTAVSS